VFARFNVEWFRVCAAYPNVNCTIATAIIAPYMLGISALSASLPPTTTPTVMPTP